MLARLLAVFAWLVLGTCLAGGPARALETAPPGIPPERPAPAPVEDPDGAGMVTLNFDAVELVEVIHVLARHLRLNYTIGPDVQGVVTIFSGQPVRREDLLPIFHEILRVHGAVAVRQGSIYRITAVSEAPGLVRPDGARGAGFAMRVLPVRFFPAAVMKRLLAPFMSTSGTILDHVRGNYLVVVDSPSNIRRLSEIKALIDVEAFSGVRMELYRPRAAAAGDLAREMSAAMALSGASEGQGEPFRRAVPPVAADRSTPRHRLQRRGLELREALARAHRRGRRRPRAATLHPRRREPQGHRVGAGSEPGPWPPPDSRGRRGGRGKAYDRSGPAAGTHVAGIHVPGPFRPRRACRGGAGHQLPGDPGDAARIRGHGAGPRRVGPGAAPGADGGAGGRSDADRRLRVRRRVCPGEGRFRPAAGRRGQRRRARRGHGSRDPRVGVYLHRGRGARFSRVRQGVDAGRPA